MAEPRNPQTSSSNTTGMNARPESDNSHPVATGVGALGGAAAGAAAGAAGGPVGSVAGAVVGAVVGGLGGNAVGRAFDPAEEDRYWRENHASEPYYETGRPYDDYGPAYTLGMTGRSTYGGRFEDVEDRLSQEWERQRGGSSLSWEQAREPSRAAWRRIDAQYPTTGDGQLMASGASSSIRSSDSDRSSSAQADLGTGLDSLAGATYSTGEAPYGDAGGRYDDQSNTLRSSAVQDLGGVVGSASQGRRVDVSSGEDSSLSGRPSPGSGMGSSRDLDQDSGRQGETGGAFGAVGAVQSASAGEVSDVDDVIDVLNDLVECCRDGEYGFNLCAEHVSHPELKRTMGRHADECRSAARELMDRIRALGGEVDDGGSVMGSMHRGWVSVKGTLAGYSDRAMAEEAERGEDAALARYHKALDEKLPEDIRALVQRQADGVKRNHDDMRSWRDRLHDRA